MSAPPTGSSPLHAAGAINAGGISAAVLNGMSVPGSHVSGTYVLTLEQPIDEAECIALVTFRGSAGADHTAVVTHTSDTVKTVTVRDSAPAPADAAFDIVIFLIKVVC